MVAIRSSLGTSATASSGLGDVVELGPLAGDLSSEASRIFLKAFATRLEIFSELGRAAAPCFQSVPSLTSLISSSTPSALLVISVISRCFRESLNFTGSFLPNCSETIFATVRLMSCKHG